MNNPSKENCLLKLIIVSDSILLNQGAAERLAFRSAIEYIAEQTGIPTALIAQTLRNQTPPSFPSDNVGSPPTAGQERQRRTAQDIADFYLAKRAVASRPPAGLAEALSTIKRQLTDAGRGDECLLVGISALPPPALNRYLGQTDLRGTLTHVYGSAADQAATAQRLDDRQDDWLRALPGQARWPSATILKGLAALHGATPAETALIGGNMGKEIAPALALGMRAVYVRLGILDGGALSENDSPATAANAGPRRPDAIVTQVQDLPGLSLFQPRTDRTDSPVRPFPPRDRER